MADPFGGVFMVMNTYQFRTGTPELQKLKFVNHFNVSSGGTITASTKLEVDNALLLGHVRHIPQGISEWSILFAFMMFKEGVAQEFTRLKAEDLLQ